MKKFCVCIFIMILIYSCDNSNSDSDENGATFTQQYLQQAFIKASNPDDIDIFGWRVALDGDTLVIAAHREDSSTTGINGDESDNSAVDGGAVYVFTKNDDIWSQQAYLKASNTEAGDFFGTDIDIDGDTIVVSAICEDSNATGINGDESDNSAEDSGAAYVFTRSGETWSQQAYLKASNTETNDQFGSSISIHGDSIIVGAYWEDSNATGINGDESDNSAIDSGAAYVFTRSGTTWSQQAYLKASNTDAGDRFGVSVDVYDDTAVIGAYFEKSNATGVNGDESDNSIAYSGAAYVFARSGVTWSQQSYLKASNNSIKTIYFARYLSIDNETIVVSAMGEASNSTGINGDESDTSFSGSGAAYVFTRNDTTWSQQAYLKASNTDAGDEFGSSVDIDANTIVIGADCEASNSTGINGDESDNSFPGSGAAYVFTRNDTTWSQKAYIKASNTDGGNRDSFGISVSVDNDNIVIGAIGESSNSSGINNGNESDNSSPESGAAYVFCYD